MTQKKTCVIYVKPKKSHKYPMCIDCSPFLYKKSNFPHQKLRRRKVWLEKRKESIDKAGNKCEWCENDQQSLAIHHPEEVNSRTYENIWNGLLNEEINIYLSNCQEKTVLVEKYLTKETKKALLTAIRYFEQETKNSLIKACPFCGGTAYNARKTMIPKYKCNDCRKTFNDLKLRSKKGVMKKSSSLKAQIETSGHGGKFSGELLSKFYQKLKLEYEKKVSQLLDEYLEMKDIKVLCIRCHGAVRGGRKLCKRCKKNYSKKEYKVCYKYHLAEEEEKDIVVKRVKEIFGSSKQDLWENNMEQMCLICGAWTFDRVSDFSEYNVHLIEKDGTLGACVGELCEGCYEIYNKTEEKSFFVKISGMKY